MRPNARLILGACALLAACGKGGDTVSLTNASLDEVAKTQAAKLQPGQWEMRIEQVSSETTGDNSRLPQMPKMPPSDTKVCLTPEQVNNPRSVFAQGSSMMKNCVYDHFTMSGGTIDAKMHCTMAGGLKIESTNTGTFSPTAIASESYTVVTGLPGGMTSKGRIKMDGKRLSECQPGDIKAGETKAGAAG